MPLTGCSRVKAVWRRGSSGPWYDCAAPRMALRVSNKPEARITFDNISALFSRVGGSRYGFVWTWKASGTLPLIYHSTLLSCLSICDVCSAGTAGSVHCNPHLGTTGDYCVPRVDCYSKMPKLPCRHIRHFSARWLLDGAPRYGGMRCGAVQYSSCAENSRARGLQLASRCARRDGIRTASDGCD